MNKYVKRLADEALSECAEYDKASARLVVMSETDEELRKCLLKMGADQAVRTANHRERQIATASIAGKDDTSGLRSLANRTLLDTWRLVGGMPIGDATQADLLASIQRHEAQATGNLRAANFERLVMKAMGKSKRVRDAIDDKKLAELHRLAEKQVPGGVEETANEAA